MTPGVLIAGAATFAALWLSVGPFDARSSGRWLRSHVLMAGVAGILLVGSLMRSAGPERLALAAILGLALVPAVALLRRQRSDHRASEVADRVLETTELLAAELAAGLPPGVALQHAAQSWSPLEPVAEAERLGADVPAALRSIAERHAGASDLRLVGAGWDAALRTGGGLADATERVATSIRANRASARVIASELASARATSRLVAGLPIAALLMGTSKESHPIEFLLGDPLGLACLAGGLAFGLLGLWWIEAIAAGVRR